MKTGIDIIADERRRQIEVEGWTPEHDDMYVKNELAQAAATYAMDNKLRNALTELVYEYEMVGLLPPTWPWDKAWYKPSPDDRIRELAKAGALIAAELDRMLRLKEKQQ